MLIAEPASKTKPEKTGTNTITAILFVWKTSTYSIERSNNNLRSPVFKREILWGLESLKTQEDFSVEWICMEKMIMKDSHQLWQFCAV